MIIRRIAGANRNFGPPKGWDGERDGKCMHLSVRISKSEDGRMVLCESAWEPTPDEIAAMAHGRSIILRIVGPQPPVMLSVEGMGDQRVQEGSTDPGSGAADRITGDHANQFRVAAAFARREAIEQCARWHDVQADKLRELLNRYGRGSYERMAQHEESAASLRALIDHGEEE